MKVFVIYTGDKIDTHVNNINELNNAVLFEYWNDRITAFQQANKITDKSTCVLLQNIVIQSGKIFVINQGTGRNIQRIEDLNIDTRGGIPLLAKPNTELLARETE